MGSEESSIANDVASVGAIGAVPAMLRIICETTGMGFAAVARVTEGSWVACAVQDNIAFGLKPGGALPVETTLCMEARAAREPVYFDDAQESAQYRDHHTPRIYNIRSYISVPIVMSGGDYFGNLCAIDPQPKTISSPEIVAMFTSFAQLIAAQLQDERRASDLGLKLEAEREESRAREAFMAVLGHDLRNPLSSLAMGAQLLIRQTAEEKTASVARRMATTAQRMRALIDDVLDLARGKFGRGMTAATKPVEDLGALIEDVLAELSLADPDAKLMSQIEVTGTVVCDPVRVQQLVSNLVANALAHGTQGHTVAVSADLVGDFLEIAVMNEGEPIPLAKQEQMFDPYSRPSGEKSDGLGLGLFIAEQIAKAHGGDIKVTSSREGGTMFLARLKAS